jgi:PAS domain S-box-containing protein
MVTKKPAMASELGRIVDALPGLVWSAFPDGQIDFLSQRWSEYTGLGIDESRGRGWQAAVHVEDLPRLLAGWRTDCASSAPVETQVRLRGPDGRYRWFLFRSHPSADASGRVVQWCGLGTDIDQRMQAEEALRASKAEALLAGEKRLLEMVASGRPMSETLEALCRTVETTASGSQCSVVLVDPSGTKLQEAIAPSLPAEFNDAVRGWPVDRLGGPCQTVARDKVQVIMADVASDTRWRNGWRALAQKHGLRSCWSTPIVSRSGKVLGTFALYQREPGNPNPLQLELIEQFTHIASIAIERAQRDAALQESEARRAEAERELQLTIDSIPTLVGTYRPDGSRIFVNRTWRDYTGLSLETAKEAERNGFVHPDDAAWVTPEWKKSLATGVPFQGEMRLRRADGEYRWHLVHRVAARNDSGAIVKWYSVGADIEERKRAEQAVRESEYKSRLMMDSIPGLVAVFTPDGEFELVNRQIVEYFGRTLEDIKLKRWGARDGVHPEDHPRVTEVFKQSIASGNPFEFELRCRRSDGVYRWFQSRGFPLRDSNGRILRWYNLLIDIDERKRAEEVVRQSEARLSEAERELRVTLDSIPVITWRGAANGYVQKLNKRWFEYTGTTPEQVRGRRWKTCIHPDDLERHVQIGIDYVAAGTPIDAEARLRRFDGEYRRFLFRPAPARDESGQIVNWYGTIIDIEDRKRAEEKAVEAERNLKLFVDTVPAQAWSARLDGSAEFFNQQYLDYVGLPEERVLDWGWTAAVHPDDLDGLTAIWKGLLASGRPGEAEARLRRHDGEYRWFLFRATPLRDDSGNIVKWYGFNTDIEDRKRAEEELRRSEALLAKAQRLSLTGSFYFNSTTEEATWSEEVYRIHEFQPGTRVTLSMIRSRYHPEDIHLFDEQVARIRSGAADLDYEHRLLMPDGSIKYVHMVAHGSRGEDGGPIAYIGAVQDVTQRRLAEAELRRSEAFLARAQQLSLTGSFSWHSVTKKFTWSEELYRIFGVQPGVSPSFEVLAERYHPEDKDRIRQIAAQVRSGPASFDYEHRLLMPDGSIKHIHVVAQRSSNQNGNGLEYFGAVQDVTQRRLAEAVLRRSEAFLARGQRLSLTGSFSFNSATQEFTWSEELYRIFEFEPGVRVTLELIGTRYHPEDRHVLEEVAERTQGGAPDFDYEHRLLMPDGSIKYIHVVAHGTPDKEGNGLEYFGAVQDITQRRVAESALDKARSELAHVTRVMSLGALTASIAHEVNQPLSGIITNASTCLRMLSADPPNIKGAQETARRTIRDGNRAADVITRLRALFGKKAPVTDTVDLNEATREVISLVFSDLLRNRVALRVELDDDRPVVVTGDRVQLQQVILNLVRNASDAMREVNDRPRHLLVKAENDEQGGARLIVKDAGVGIDPQAMGRLFDAFYTNKEDGMGIGLSVSRSIIESHGGKLWAEANDGPGTTFSFSIPCSPASEIDSHSGDAVLIRKTSNGHE